MLGPLPSRSIFEGCLEFIFEMGTDLGQRIGFAFQVFAKTMVRQDSTLTPASGARGAPSGGGIVRIDFFVP